MDYDELLKDYKDVLLPEDVMEILHIGRSKMYGCLSDGTIPSIKIGKKYRIPKPYLKEYLQSSRYRTAKEA